MNAQGGRARSRLDDKQTRTEAKKVQFEKAAHNGLPNGIVHIVGDLDAHGEEQLRNIIHNIDHAERNQDVTVLEVLRDEEGLHVETETEKLAQHIADAIVRSRNAEVERIFVDATKTRILTVRLP